MYFAFGSAQALPARAIIPAMIGEEALVPPTTIQSPPWYTATPVAGSRSVELELLLSTSTMWHSGHTADTMSRSRAISTLQSSSGLNFGRGVVLPFWLSLRKQPFWVVHAGRPYALRYTARSASAVGSSLASTIATVLPAPPVVGNRYADTRSVRARPFGAALVA